MVWPPDMSVSVLAPVPCWVLTNSWTWTESKALSWSKTLAMILPITRPGTSALMPGENKELLAGPLAEPQPQALQRVEDHPRLLQHLLSRLPGLECKQTFTHILPMLLQVDKMTLDLYNSRKLVFFTQFNFFCTFALNITMAFQTTRPPIPPVTPTTSFSA